MRVVATQVTLNDLARCCKREATWSIDIAYLLRDYGLECVFYTITRGVRPEYFFQSFYKRLLDTCDTERVIERFRNAERSGVKVIERTVSITEIRSTIAHGNKLLLVLIDRCLLRCSICAVSQGTKKLYHSLSTSHGFLGHYILLYAFHEDSDSFLVKDPASYQECCVVSASNLEMARKAFGTDEDIIFIADVVDQQAHRDFSCSSISPSGLSSQPSMKRQRIQRNDNTIQRQPSEPAKSLVPVSPDTSSSKTVGRDILNFILRKVLGVATPRTRLP